MTEISFLGVQACFILVQVVSPDLKVLHKQYFICVGVHGPNVWEHFSAYREPV